MSWDDSLGLLQFDYDMQLQDCIRPAYTNDPLHYWPEDLSIVHHIAYLGVLHIYTSPQCIENFYMSLGVQSRI